MVTRQTPARKSRRWGSNPQPPGYRSGALPIELRRHKARLYPLLFSSVVVAFFAITTLLNVVKDRPARRFHRARLRNVHPRARCAARRHPCVTIPPAPRSAAPAVDRAPSRLRKASTPYPRGRTSPSATRQTISILRLPRARCAHTPRGRFPHV